MDAQRGGREADPISPMSNDNTDSALPTSGSMMGDSAMSTVISQVREGMRVLDASGEELGTVDIVKMGDPGAATVGADEPADPGFIASLFVDQHEPDLPEALRDRLLRFGYIKIDGKGWIDTDRYVTGDLIGRIDSDAVTLTVNKDRLLTGDV